MPAAFQGCPGPDSISSSVNILYTHLLPGTTIKTIYKRIGMFFAKNIVMHCLSLGLSAQEIKAIR